MGRQIVVNQYQNNWQRESDVLALADGGFLVVWSSYLNNYDDTGYAATVISGRRFDAVGRPATNEFVIEAVDGTASGLPSIAPLAGGGYAIASTFSPTDDILGATQVWVQPYGATGAERGPDVRVDTPTPAEEQYEATDPSVAGLRNGGYLTFYVADQNDSTFDDIYLRFFDPQGRPVGPDQVVNTRVATRDQLEVEAVTLANGNVLAIWNSEDTLRNANGGYDFEIRGSLYSPTGQLLRSDFHLSPNVGVISPYPGLSGDFDVAPLAGGGFAISRFDYGFRSGTGDADPLLFQTFDAAGRPASRPVVVYATEEVQFDSEIVQLATGEIVVVWEQYPINGDVGVDLYGRMFAADGRALTGIFQVGQNFSEYDTQEGASLRALAGGGFVVSFTHDNLDADDEGIAVQVFGRGTAGADRLAVDASSYLAGGAGNDQLNGDARANVLNGGPGDDILTGGAGNDQLAGAAGRDVLAGGVGNDTYLLVDRADAIVEIVGGGLDQVRSSVSAALAANLEILVLTGAAAIGGAGNALANRLFGNVGGNVLNGGGGADALAGGRGADVLIGGTGADDFIFSAPAESGPGRLRDTIADFARGQDDLVLSAIDANAAVAGNQAFRLDAGGGFRAGEIRQARYGSDLYLDLNTDGDGDAEMSIRLSGVTGPLAGGDVLL